MSCQKYLSDMKQISYISLHMELFLLPVVKINSFTFNILYRVRVNCFEINKTFLKHLNGEGVPIETILV